MKPKHPKTPHEVYEATQAELRRWIEKSPTLKAAILTGKRNEPHGSITPWEPWKDTGDAFMTLWGPRLNAYITVLRY